jgi:hypothetical protein
LEAVLRANAHATGPSHGSEPVGPRDTLNDVVTSLTLKAKEAHPALRVRLNWLITEAGKRWTGAELPEALVKRRNAIGQLAPTHPFGELYHLDWCHIVFDEIKKKDYAPHDDILPVNGATPDIVTQLLEHKAIQRAKPYETWYHFWYRDDCLYLYVESHEDMSNDLRSDAMPPLRQEKCIIENVALLSVLLGTNASTSDMYSSPKQNDTLRHPCTCDKSYRSHPQEVKKKRSVHLVRRYA